MLEKNSNYLKKELKINPKLNKYKDFSINYQMKLLISLLKLEQFQMI